MRAVSPRGLALLLLDTASNPFDTAVMDLAALGKSARVRTPTREGRKRREYSRVLSLIADNIAGVIGDACCVALVRPGNRLEVVAVSHRSEEARKLLRELVPPVVRLDLTPLASRVVKTGEALFIEQTSAARLRTFAGSLDPYLTRFGTVSVMAVPLTAPQGVVGAIGVSRDSGGGSYCAADLALLTRLAEGTAAGLKWATPYPG
jgi:GAF domain-containing protein